jgi:hypothetical protein
MEMSPFSMPIVFEGSKKVGNSDSPSARNDR